MPPKRGASGAATVDAQAQALPRLGGTHDDGDTVGAVVRDQRGHLAVAVSTGGLWLKTPGRVGDSPLPGAGYWAEDGLLACCATGTGEFIARSLLCAEIRHRVASGASLREATESAFASLQARFGSEKAGVILLGPRGAPVAHFDTQGMGHGLCSAENPTPRVLLWPEEGIL